MEKEDWKWDDEAKIMHNPLSKDLDAIDSGDEDYDFSVYRVMTEDEGLLPVGTTDNIPKAGVYTI